MESEMNMNIRISDDFKSIYSNHASIRTSVYDFAIEFGEVDKIEINKNQADMYVELKARIVMSPQHAKAFSTF
ncbi:MAG: DUF3467 domain-containing protein [Thermotogaceae bacterium]|nr:DUF3467 domain-containing protein [Thermotogaceae bacterium]